MGKFFYQILIILIVERYFENGTAPLNIFLKKRYENRFKQGNNLVQT